MKKASTLTGVNVHLTGHPNKLATFISYASTVIFTGLVFFAVVNYIINNI